MDAQKASKPQKNDDSPTKDKIFDPSIDMLINDFDDERTLEEEEALAAGESQDPSAELSSLEKEGNMPLEELLALYGYNNKENTPQEDEDSNNEDIEQDEPMEVADNEPQPAQKPSKLSEIYEPMPDPENEDMKITETVSKLSDDEEEDLGNYSSDEEMKKLKKTIMIGKDYQAQVPQGLTTYDVLPYENDDKLMWIPNEALNNAIEEYLEKAHKILKTTIRKVDKNALPNGAHLRDNEQALMMLQQCGYDTEKALQRLELTVQTENCKPKPKDNEWSDIECKNFEEGIKAYGKNFLLIQKEFVKTRSVNQLVEFYYLWKKTERHEMFATKTKIDKKKYILNPGLTDFMDRFLEEHQKSQNASNCQNVSIMGGKSYSNT